MNLIGPIEMSDFESSILELQGALMFVAYFILVTGLILRIMRISDTSGDMVAMTKAVFIGFFLVMLIATDRYWFEGMDQGMNDAAGVINANFGSEPFAVADALVKTIDEDPEAEGWGMERIVNSIYLSIIYGISKLGITLAAVFQVPFYILQYVIKWLGFLFLPIGLSLFIFPSLSSIGVKLIGNLLAVMAWPIGFAITNLAAMSFVNDFATASTFTGNDSGTALYMMSFGSLIMGLIAALILVIGTLATPTIMFMIFSSGAGLQGLTGAATSAAAFTTYLAGSFGGRGAAAAVPSAPASAPAPAPASAGVASSHVNESSAAYGSSETALAPVLNRYAPPLSGGGGQPALPGGGYSALPGPPSPSNPILPISPHDPSGSQRAAMLFARGTTPKPIINI